MVYGIQKRGRGEGCILRANPNMVWYMAPPESCPQPKHGQFTASFTGRFTEPLENPATAPLTAPFTEPFAGPTAAGCGLEPAVLERGVVLLERGVTTRGGGWPLLDSHYQYGMVYGIHEGGWGGGGGGGSCIAQ